MSKKIYGPSYDHPQFVASLHQIGRVCEEEGNYDAAEKLRRAHGHNADHVDIATSLHDLGILLLERGQLDEVERL